MQLIEGTLKQKLKTLILEKQPFEAAGLIFPTGEVKELRNRAEDPRSNFLFYKEDLVVALDGVEDVSEVIVWHSHPGGGIGPSLIDMRQKTPFPYHLVLTIVDNDIVPTWY